MPTVTADKVVNHLMYSKANVNATDATGKKTVKSFVPGDLIGNVFSWVEINNEIYWLFYLTPADYNNFNAVYVKHDSNKLELPDLPGILQQIADEKKAAIIAKDGIVGYYVQTYLPWIIGAIVVSIALPAITKSVKK
jgi:hypothetical protein